MLGSKFKEIIRLWIVPCLIILVGASASIYAYVAINDTINTEAQIIFADKGTVAIYLLKHQLEADASLLAGLRPYFAQSRAFSAESFGSYTQSFNFKDDYKAVAKIVYWSKDLGPQSSSSSPDEIAGVPYAVQFSYYPVATSSGPQQGDSLSLVEIETSDRALKSGEAALSPKISLWQGTAGFIIVEPVFKDNLVPLTTEGKERNIIGFVAAYIRADYFFENNLLPTKDVGWAYYDLHVYDGSSQNINNRMLYYDHNKDLNEGFYKIDYGFDNKQTFAALDRVWTLVGYGNVSNQISRLELAAPGIILVGGLLFCLLIAFLIRASYGSLKRAQALASKMTMGLRRSQTKLAHQAKDLERFKLAVDNASDHVVITDSNGIIIYANRGVESVTGFTREEVLGKKAGSRELWGGRMDKEFYEKMWQTIKHDKQHFTGEINNLRKNGQPYVALSSISPILSKTGEVEYFVAIEQDITREKEIDREKTEFVSLASHQLRTPLTAIKWCTEVLLSEETEKLSVKQNLYLKRILQSNERMIDLVSSLLNVARMDMGTMAVELKPIALAQAVEAELQDLQQDIRLKGIEMLTVIPDKLPSLQTDANMLHIILQNLLSNAVKYTPDQGQVRLEVKQAKNNILLSVSDNGYGIPPEAFDKIFNKLFRADNVIERETDGNGLGLYLAKAVVEKLGGRVWFESKLNEGTTFFVELPLIPSIKVTT